MKKTSHIAKYSTWRGTEARKKKINHEHRIVGYIFTYSYDTTD